MKSLLKSLSLLIAITCTVWVIVLWRWQATQHDLSVGDIALYLGALPLVLFATAMLARWALSGLADRAARRDGAKTATTTTPTRSHAPATSGEAELRATMHLLAAPLNCAAGQSARGVAAAIVGQRPGLDAHLVDDDGLPVMTARIERLALDSLSPPLELVAALARRREAAWASMEPSPSIGRALAALSPCLDAVFEALRPWSERMGVAHDSGAAPFAPPWMNAAREAGGSTDAIPAHPAQIALAGVSTASPTQSRPNNLDSAARHVPPARVLVYVAWPQDATAFDRAVADHWLQRAMDKRRDGIVASGRIVRPPAEPAMTGPALLRHADEAMVRMRRESAPHDLVLVLAAESRVVESCVRRWQHEGLLCSSRNPKGRIPGEAAAALLLAPEPWASDGVEGHEPAAQLHRPPIAMRNKSIDAIGRIDPAVATHVAEQAMVVTGIAPADFGALVSDADQVTPRGLETYATTHALLAHLDAADDVMLTGVPCGDVGAVSTLIAVALAAHHALERDQPCLALSVGDALARTAIVARAPSPAASAPEPAPRASQGTTAAPTSATAPAPAPVSTPGPAPALATVGRSA